VSQRRPALSHLPGAQRESRGVRLVLRRLVQTPTAATGALAWRRRGAATHRSSRHECLQACGVTKSPADTTRARTVRFDDDRAQGQEGLATLLGCPSAGTTPSHHRSAMARALRRSRAHAPACRARPLRVAARAARASFTNRQTLLGAVHGTTQATAAYSCGSCTGCPAGWQGLGRYTCPLPPSKGGGPGRNPARHAVSVAPLSCQHCNACAE
jgi:hypothetical protein